QFFGNLNYVIIAALGGFQVATGALSFGATLAFIQYSRQFAIPVSQVAGQLNMIQSGLASAGRVLEFLGTPEEAVRPGMPAAAQLAPPERAPAAHRLQLLGVSFRYDQDRPLIEDFTLEAAPGQTVAIVGPTGA